LVAHLDDATIVSCGGDKQLSLSGIVAARLFYIHMLSRGACQYRSRRVPVVARRNDDGVEGLVIEHAAEVADRFRRRLAGFFHFLGCFSGSRRVHVADVRHFHSEELRETLGVLGSPSAGPHDPHKESLIGACGARAAGACSG
jgi:hypothetical protein